MVNPYRLRPVEQLLSIALGLAACKGTPTCEQMADRLGKHIAQLGAPAERRDSVRICYDRAWSGELRRCVAEATDPHAMDDCVSRLATDGHGDHDTGEARDTIYEYVDEAFPKWSMSHSGACPDKIDDLDVYLHQQRAPNTDPWGNPYQLRCGRNLPAGAEGIAVWSFGPDGREGTPDDIQSWK
jgi:hypothetical protein